MFVNTHVFINSPVVYKLWWGGGGGGGGEGSWNISSRVPNPPPPLPRLASGTGSTDLRMSRVTVTVLCGFSFTNNGPQITIF